MAAKHSLDEKIARLEALKLEPTTPETIKELRKALKGANSILASAAASAAEAIGATELADDLTGAFERHMVNGDKTDKSCLAKIAIVEALTELGYSETEIFIAGLHHIQMEPVWGGQADTADELRSKCAYALAKTGCRELFIELTRLLFDPMLQPRRAAIQVLSSLDRDESELLLRAKIAAGDQDPNVICDCLSGLMRVAPERSLELVAGYLHSPKEGLAEGAAAALGQSRLPEAFAELKSAWDESVDSEFKKMLLLPLALLRSDESFEFLLRAVEQEHRALAAEALAALRLYRNDTARRGAIQRAVESRDESEISEMFGEEFGDAE